MYTEIMKTLFLALIILCLYTPPALAQTPYGGTAFSPPGILEAEDFDEGGQGVAYYDTESTNQGNSAYRDGEWVDIGTSTDNNTPVVAWYKTPEWLLYTISVNQPGTYDLGVRMAHAYAGASIDILVDDMSLLDSPLAIPNTGDWNIYQTVTTQFHLPSGTHQLKVVPITNASNGFAGNFNYLSFTLLEPSINADINADGFVDYLDYQLLLSNFDQIGNLPGDINGDSQVDIFDFNHLINQYGTTPPPTHSPPPPTLTPTTGPSPTPTTQPAPSPTPNASGTVVVDIANTTGPVTYRAAGFLGNDISDTNPSNTIFNTYWAPLKLQLFSWIQPSYNNQQQTYTFKALNRAISQNAYYQIKLRNPGTDYVGVNSSWGQTIQAVTQAATNTGYGKIQLDILNEPDWSGYWPGNGNVNDPAILEAWRTAYDAHVLVNPNIDIVGPNILAGLSWNWLTGTFLPTMHGEGRLPDVVSWHEINTNRTQIASRAQQVRTLLDSWGRTDIKMSINEYNYTSDYVQPGYGVQFIHELEKAQIQSSSRACWDEPSGGDYDCVPTINGFLTTTGQPRSIWHTYKAYTDMTGNLVSLSSTSNITGIASVDMLNNNIQLLLGRYTTSNSNFTIMLNNLQHSPFNLTQPISATIYRIPNTGTNALASPQLYQQQDYSAQNNTINLTVNDSTDSPTLAAYHIILTQ
jgi:hypothetical protein